MNIVATLKSPKVFIAIAGAALVVAFLYYRNSSQAAATTAADSTSSGGGFPYFQTAALPSSITGASTGTVTTAASAADPNASGANATDFASLLASLASSQATAAATTAAASTQSGFAASAASLLQSLGTTLINSVTGAGNQQSSSDAFLAGATKEFGLAQQAISANNDGSGNTAGALASLENLGPSNARTDIWGGLLPSTGGSVAAPPSAASRIIGNINVGGVDAAVNLIADHPSSSGLYLNTPPLVFVGGSGVVGGSSSQQQSAATMLATTVQLPTGAQA